MKRQIVIYGAGGMARWVFSEMAASGVDSGVAGFVVDEIGDDAGQLFGRPVTAFASAEFDYPPSDFSMLVLTGYRRMRDRVATIDRAKAKGYHLFSFVSQRAITYPDLDVGENVVIGPGAHVGHGCRLGLNVTVAQCAHVGTGAVVHAHTYIAARAVIGGKPGNDPEASRE